MKIDLNTLIIGFLGSLIGIFLSGTYGRITTAFKLNLTRKVILNYFETIAIPKCEKYIEDTNLGINFIEKYEKNTTSETNTNDWKLDYMPMFNSDILKSISPEILLQTSFKAKTHSDLIEIAYTIDFLKNHMAYDKINVFIEKVKKHLEKKKLKNIEFHSHLQTCPYYKQIKYQILEDFKLKVETSKGLNDEQKEVVKDLKGTSIIWILKYIWRQ